MGINIEKVEEIYGDDILNLVRENIQDVIKNLNYLEKIEFSDIEDIFERYAPIFICGPMEFEEKINRLIFKLGINYVDIIENDLSILEELL